MIITKQSISILFEVFLERPPFFLYLCFGVAGEISSENKSGKMYKIAECIDVRGECMRGQRGSEVT
jgi:hypothetical protein